MYYKKLSYKVLLVYLYKSELNFFSGKSGKVYVNCSQVICSSLIVITGATNGY